jgi:hypothetical protein
MKTREHAQREESLEHRVKACVLTPLLLFKAWSGTGGLKAEDVAAAIYGHCP